MDSEYDEEDQAFQTEVRAFLRASAQLRPPGKRRIEVASRGDVAAAKAWQRRKADARLAGIALPTRFGGRGGSIRQQMIYDQEELHYDVPSDFLFMIGLGHCAPTLIRESEALAAAYLPAMIRGEEIWCQLFSEPGAGSDLAGVRVRAERDGDMWRINGQKIWTSGAHVSDRGLLLARTDPNLPRHRGLGFFVVDMHAPGVEVRPIKQMSGEWGFNEVFFDDVLIADDQRVGAPTDGWRLAVAMLADERLTVGRVLTPDVLPLLRLADRCRIGDKPAIEHAAVREKIARWYVEQRGVSHTISRIMTALTNADDDVPEGAIIKLVDSVRDMEMSDFALDLLAETGGDGFASDDMTSAIAEYLAAPAARIAGGTEEILLNVIGERVLGLPPEPRPDRNAPFAEGGRQSRS